jgi:hypothetical protein
VFSGTASVIAVPLGVRWNLAGVLWRQSLKPFIGASVGPVIGGSTGATVTTTRVDSGASTHTTIGGVVGGGVDVHLGRSWSLGVDGGYQWMSKFPEPVGGRREYRGLQLGVGSGGSSAAADATRPPLTEGGLTYNRRGREAGTGSRRGDSEHCLCA